MDRPLKETVYTPDSELRSFGRLIRSMGRDLVASRELAWRLFVRNVRAQYRQSALGYVWAFIPPIYITLIWVFLQSHKVFTVSDPGMPYPLFVLTGTVLWATFTESLHSPLQSVNQNRAMLTKINFPREALILSGVGQVLFNFGIRALLLAAVFVWFSVPITWGLALVPLGVLALIAFGVATGLLLTPLGMLYTDVGRAIEFITRGLFFLTPIIYPVPQSSWAEILVTLNPVTPLLQTTRAWMVNNETDMLGGFLLVAGLSSLLLLMAWVLYRISMHHLISRMSA